MPGGLLRYLGEQLLEADGYMGLNAFDQPVRLMSIRNKPQITIGSGSHQSHPLLSEDMYAGLP